MQDLISFIMIMAGSIVSLFGFVVLILFILLNIYNEVHRSKYNKLMSHLEEYHNEIYEEIRIKPVLGPLYPSGAYRKSILYAKDHPPINDPIAEQLFSDYAEFSQLSIKAIRDLIKDISSRRLQPGYKKQDIRTGVIIGITIGFVVGAIIGNIDLHFFPLPVYETLGTFYGAIIGSFGGIVGGAYSSVREFGWEMTPLSRAVFGAVFGAFSWVMALSVLRSMWGIFI